ncbi:serine protease, partial [Leptospira interrogans serovar Pomona]|nr:serine protease [Leptospira interrogans serovar Pomona]
MDFFGNRESNENFVMGLYFSILKFFGVILYFGLFYFSCFSPIAQTKETETEIESKQEI